MPVTAKAVRCWIWCPRCGRVGEAVYVTPAQMSRRYDEHQAACPKQGQAAAASEPPAADRRERPASEES
jgi:hypothetical protein